DDDIDIVGQALAGRYQVQAHDNSFVVSIRFAGRYYSDVMLNDHISADIANKEGGCFRFAAL
ncbi:MAG: hypothetical protein ACRC9G_11360, partial [Aeromonas veronii]